MATSKHDETPTPDLLPRFQTSRKLDHAEHGTIGHDMAPIIIGARDAANSPLGPSRKMDQGRSNQGVQLESSLGAGSGSNSTDIKGGARSARVNWGGVKTAAHQNPKYKNG